MIRTDPPSQIAAAPWSANGRSGLVTYQPRIHAHRRQIDDRFSSLSFTVDPGGRSWFEVLLATDASMFDPANTSRRTDATFYTSRRDGGLLPASQASHPFLVPSGVIRGFAVAVPRPTAIYYTLIAYEGSDGSGPAFAHEPQSMAISAPAVAITGDFSGTALATVLSVSVNKLNRLGSAPGAPAALTVSEPVVELEDGYGAPLPLVTPASASGLAASPVTYPGDDASPPGYQLALLPGPEAGRPQRRSPVTAGDPLLPGQALARQGRVFGTELAAPEPLMLGSVPGPIEWPPGGWPANWIADLFRSEYNERLAESVWVGPTAVLGSNVLIGAGEAKEEQARQRTLDRIADIAARISTPSEQTLYWEAYYRLALASAVEAAAVLRPLIGRGPGATVTHDLSVPISVLYLAKRAGMMLEWLDAAILGATSMEAERIALIKRGWKAQSIGLSLVTALPVFGDVASAVGDAVSFLLDQSEPDFDRDFASYRAALDQFRYTCEKVAGEIFRAALTEGVPNSDLARRPEIGGFISTYKAYVLLGWDEETRFLQIRP